MAAEAGGASSASWERGVWGLGARNLRFRLRVQDPVSGGSRTHGEVPGLMQLTILNPGLCFEERTIFYVPGGLCAGVTTIITELGGTSGLQC